MPKLLLLHEGSLLSVYTLASGIEAIDLIVLEKGEFCPPYLQVKGRFGLSGRGHNLFIQDIRVKSFRPYPLFYIVFAYLDPARLELHDNLFLVPSEDTEVGGVVGRGRKADRRYRITTSLNPTPRTWCSEPQKIAQVNDVLISVRAPVGPTNLCKEECCIGRGPAAIRPRDGVHFKFPLYFLRFMEPVLGERGQGSTFKAITKKQLTDLEIPIPALGEQLYYVVAYRDSLHAKVEQLDRLQHEIQAQLDALIPAVLAKAFRGKL